MKLFCSGLEWMTITQFYQHLLTINQGEEQIETALEAIGMGSMHDRSIAEQSLPAPNQLASYPYILFYLEQLDAENISVDAGRSAGVATLLWLHIFNVDQILMRPHQIPYAYIEKGLDVTGLSVRFTENISDKDWTENHDGGDTSRATLSHLTTMVCFLRTLSHYQRLCYINDNQSPALHIHNQSYMYSTLNQKKAIVCVVEEMEHGPGESSAGIPVGSDYPHTEEHIDPGMVILQTNIDDLNPEIIPYIMERLLEAGANDVYCQPISMKKGRMGTMVNVLCEIDQADQMESILFTETSTFGIRKINASVHRLGRRVDEIETPWGKVRIKTAYRQGRAIQVSPEHADCLQIAQYHDISLQDVYHWVRSQYNMPSISRREQNEC